MRWLGRLGVAASIWCAAWLVESYLPASPRGSLWVVLVPAVGCALPLAIIAMGHAVLRRGGEVSVTRARRAMLGRFSPVERVLVLGGSLLFGLGLMHAVFSLDGSPTMIDGHYYLLNHGTKVEVGPDAYRHALALTQRAVVGFCGFALVWSSAVLRDLVRVPYQPGRPAA